MHLSVPRSSRSTVRAAATSCAPRRVASRPTAWCCAPPPRWPPASWPAWPEDRGGGPRGPGVRLGRHGHLRGATLRPRPPARRQRLPRVHGTYRYDPAPFARNPPAPPRGRAGPRRGHPSLLALAPAVPAGAQSITADAGIDDAARQVAQRRATEYRRQSDLAKEKLAALAALFQAQANAVAGRPRARQGRHRPRPPVLPRGRRPQRLRSSPASPGGPGRPPASISPTTAAPSGPQTDHIAVEELQPGDIVFFWGPGRAAATPATSASTWATAR